MKRPYWLLTSANCYDNTGNELEECHRCPDTLDLTWRYGVHDGPGDKECDHHPDSNARNGLQPQKHQVGLRQDNCC